ncbi:MAG TPA: CAP domain-containing protein, partial [Candidatus Saccharibacteria bacterium]|nr:CAP domain-containing protein [Candidatus Saccharibacteria bacterium]
KKVSYSYDIAGENLAITNENANAVINGWLNSPSHRENLLSDDYQDFGIGMAFFGDYEGHKNTYVIVALYAKPAEKQVVTAPTSPAGTTTNFKPKLGDIPVAFIIAIAGLFMVIGSFIEIRHIKEINRSPTL